MREVPVPGSENALRPSKVGCVEGYGGPIDIPDEHTTAGAQGPIYLRERGRNLRDILEHPHRQRGVEARLLDW
jgi:hypothetical protein